MCGILLVLVGGGHMVRAAAEGRRPLPVLVSRVLCRPPALQALPRAPAAAPPPSLLQVLWWGFACFPAAQLAFTCLYYACGALSVAAALKARTAVGRGVPMLALLLVRLAAFGARAALEGAAAGPALRHYFAMEVRCP